MNTPQLALMEIKPIYMLAILLTLLLVSLETKAQSKKTDQKKASLASKMKGQWVVDTKRSVASNSRNNGPVKGGTLAVKGDGKFAIEIVYGKDDSSQTTGELVVEDGRARMNYLDDGEWEDDLVEFSKDGKTVTIYEEFNKENWKIVFVRAPRAKDSLKKGADSGSIKSGRVSSAMIRAVAASEEDKITLQHAQITDESVLARLDIAEVGDLSGVIKQLGSSVFHERQTAAKTILDAGPGVVAQLKKHINSTDIEVSSQAVKLIKQLRVRDYNNVIVDIRSLRGGGSGELFRTGKQWPKSLALRFHLRALEGLRINNGTVTILGSIKTGQSARLSLHTGKTESRIKKGEPFWTRMAYTAQEKTGRDVPQSIEFEVPKALLSSNPKSLRIRWIDYYRH